MRQRIIQRNSLVFIILILINLCIFSCGSGAETECKSSTLVDLILKLEESDSVIGILPHKIPYLFAREGVVIEKHSISMWLSLNDEELMTDLTSQDLDLSGYETGAVWSRQNLILELKDEGFAHIDEFQRENFFKGIDTLNYSPVLCEFGVPLFSNDNRNAVMVIRIRRYGTLQAVRHFFTRQGDDWIIDKKETLVVG